MDGPVATVIPESRVERSISTLLAHVPDFESDIERVLISSEEIQSKIRDLGEQVTADYQGHDLLLVGVLKGAFVVMADLSRHIRLPLQFLQFHFCARKICGIFLQRLKAGSQLGFPGSSYFNLVGDRVRDLFHLGINFGAQIA